jgi:AhpC/TSA family
MQLGQRNTWLRRLPAAALMGVFAVSATHAAAAPATVLYRGSTTAVQDTLPDPTDLWTSPADLTRITGFELQGERACLGKTCVEDKRLITRRSGKTWVNVTGLARQLQQPFAADYDKNVWSLGLVPAARTDFAQAAMAPDFAMKDRTGRVVRLSDFRGKKVLLVTWASW